MTREEAKTNLNMIRVAFGVPVTKEQKELVDETFDMAIQALSQEPCDDAVSRKDIQDYIAKYLSQYLYEDVRQAVEVIDAYIGDMPSVTQKSGKWIETEYHRWKCSVCREKGMSEWDNIHDVRTNYCPNCGAKMI